MKYNIKGESVEITEALDQFVKSRLDALNKYFVIDDSTEAIVKLSVGKGGASKIEEVKIAADSETDHEDELVLEKDGSGTVGKVEVTIPTKYGEFRAEATEKELYDAIDRVVDKLERQIRKQKAKLKKSRRVKEKIGLALNPEFLETTDEFDDIDDEQGVVRVKEITPEAKDVETAILEMEMLHHDFYIYRDIETEQIHVVYKRKKGGYGVIETKTQG